jgi:hypothetical protein
MLWHQIDRLLEQLEVISTHSHGLARAGTTDDRLHIVSAVEAEQAWCKPTP